MKFTSAQANKLIKSLEDKKSFLLQRERNDSTYVLADDEDYEKPDYDFVESNKEIDELDKNILKLKHALNVFNTTTTLPLGITIDTALVEMSQINNKLNKLDVMRKAKDKVRMSGYNAGRRDVAEYTYLNYNPKDVQEVYEKAYNRLQEIQLALDKANQTEEFEVDINL